MPRTETFPTVVYTSGSALKSPGKLVRKLASDTVRSRHVIWELLRRDLTSQYRQSVLGVLISLLPALTTTAWAILFRSAHLINVGRSSVPYPFFVLCGMMVWAAFLESLDAPISGVLSEQALLSKASIPPEAVTFARLGQVFVNFFVKAIVVAVAALFYRIPIPWTAVFVPLGIAAIVALGAGIGLILAPFNFLYRDISKALPVITTFWFFLTPIIFVSPEEGIASVIMNRINPVTQILMATRDLNFHRIAMPVAIDRANS